jgi:single-strand DNA-binding protein
MSLQINKVFIAGRLTRTPELKEGNKSNWCKVGVAVNRNKEEVDFFDVTMFEKSAETMCAMCTKGTPVFIEGRLTINKRDMDDGSTRTYYGITAYSWQFVESKRQETVAASTEDVGNWDDAF